MGVHLSTQSSQMSSGVVSDPELVELFGKFKLGKSDHVSLIIKISKEEGVAKLVDTVDKADVEGLGHEEIHSKTTDKLREDDPVYVIEDFKFKDGNDMQQSKICLIKWVPDSAGMKTKMLYASSCDGVKQPLVGISKEIHGSDFDDVSYANIRSEFA